MGILKERNSPHVEHSKSTDSPPEAYNLLGYVAALQGDFEDAVENYRQAIALDDTYLEAMLNAAEVCIHPMGEFDDALSLCEQALDLAENDDETVDALLLCFDAHLGKGDVEAAKDICRKFPKGPFENLFAHVFSGSCVLRDR